ncbi:hypothetical protein [Nostoc sp.]|uniref:hypothetical protein n=1 Tax=Nostoc sp. TaxID=1180 RepID=UPI002FFC410C
MTNPKKGEILKKSIFEKNTIQMQRSLFSASPIAQHLVENKKINPRRWVLSV